MKASFFLFVHFLLDFFGRAGYNKPSALAFPFKDHLCQYDAAKCQSTAEDLVEGKGKGRSENADGGTDPFGKQSDHRFAAHQHAG